MTYFNCNDIITISNKERNTKKVKGYKDMTRTDLEKKSITKLNTIDEAIEMINVLTYEECIELLKRCHDLPVEIFKAIINRARSLKGLTTELLIMSMQSAVNK